MPVDKTTATDAVLSFRGSVWDCYPRMLWQRLFNFYRDQGCPLDHMDNMLIDLKNCEEVFVGMDRNTVRFLWAFDPGCWSTTWRWEKSWKSSTELMAYRRI